MRQSWWLKNKKADYEGLCRRFGINEVVARIIRNREIVSEEDFDEYLNAGLDSLHEPFLLKDMDKAVSIIRTGIDSGETFRIIGDYDIDGINSIYILYSGLKRLGADVDYVVPHRVSDGYGVNIKLLDDAKNDGRRIIITCDNGIAAIEQADHAKELGLTMVVTDHHEIPIEVADGVKRYILPDAAAVIDPKRPDCPYPFKHICGAVVAFKLIEALFAEYGRPSDEIFDFLEFAAIATVGDIVELKGENRTIVKYGLKKIASTDNIGLKALITVNKLSPDKLSAYHIGFVIGPCLNASGRLDSAKQAIELLLATDREDAERKAGDLLALNEERKYLTLKGTNEAFELIDGSDLSNDKVLVVYLKDCHESIVGIIAGRIRERYNKPAIVFADGEGCLKGSGRSIEGYNMFEKLSECKSLLLKFGGHPMAAGMSIAPGNLEDFRRLVNENCGLTDDDLVLKVWIDISMPFGYVTPKLVESLSVLEPFGKGNEKPVFAGRRLLIRRLNHIGREKQFTKMTLVDENGCSIDAVMFSQSETAERAYEEGKHIKVLYYPEINEYQGNVSVQIIVNNVELSE